jgi:hypothetical protein
MTIILGMKVIGFDPSITIKSAWKLTADVEQALSVDELFSQSDFVFFHVSLIANYSHNPTPDKYYDWQVTLKISPTLLPHLHWRLVR